MAKKYPDQVFCEKPPRPNRAHPLFQLVNVQGLGRDLIALAFYTQSFQNAILWCLGTAHTALVVKNHTLIGYLIAPGSFFSYQALLTRTKISIVSLKAHQHSSDSSRAVYGTNTQTAFWAGWQLSNLALIYWTEKIQQQDFAQRCPVIMTGGGMSAQFSWPGQKFL